MLESSKNTVMNLRKEGGITLLALIVVLIVLLILSGISIAMLTGENGIFNNAAKAKRLTDAASIEEKIKLSVMSARTKGLGKIDEAELKKELTNYFGAEETGYKIAGNSKDGFWIIINKNNISYHIEKSGELKEAEYDEANNQIESLILGFVDDLGTRSTIYLYNNVNNITEGTITITMPDSTTETITAIGDTSNISSEFITDEQVNDILVVNNFATYTVSKNGTYTFSATANGETTKTKVIIKNIEQFKAIETLASEENLSYAGGGQKAYTYKGASVPKGYYVDTKSEVSTGLVVTDEIDSDGYSTGNEWVWVPVNSTIGNDDYYGEEAQATPLGGASDVTYTKYSKLYSFMDKTREPYGTFHKDSTYTGTLGRPSDTTNYREIAVQVGSGISYDAANITSIKNRQTNELFTSSNTISDVATQYRDDYESMVESVDNYKGFYIGRYEITADGEKPGNSLVNMNWYEFYNESMELEKINTESGMIYGCLWDATMQWLAYSNISVGYTENNTSGFGNFAQESVVLSDGDMKITVKPVMSKEIQRPWRFNRHSIYVYKIKNRTNNFYKMQ